MRAGRLTALPRLVPLSGTWLLVVPTVSGTILGLLLANFFALFAAARGVLETAGSERIVPIGGLVLQAAAGTSGLLCLAAFGVIVTQVVVPEKVTYGKAIARNWRLILGRLPPVTGAVPLCALLAGGFILFLKIYGTLTYTIRTASSLFPALEGFTENWLASGPAALVRLFRQPLPMICITPLYGYQRVRHEEQDLAMLERRLGAEHGSQRAADTHTAHSRQRPVLTGAWAALALLRRRSAPVPCP